MIRFLVLAGCALPLVSAAKPSSDPAATRELIKQWVQTERLISEEKTAWQMEKKQMQDLLEIYQKELKLLDEELETAGASAESVDEDKRNLEQDLAEHRTARRLLRETMARLLPRVQGIIAQFPKPLAAGLEADISQLNDPAALENPRDVLKSMIAVLAGAGKFNRTVTLEEETRDAGNGEKLSVNVLYLGLCRAYYAADCGDVAGTGVPAANGWKWEAAPEIASGVRRVIAVYQKTKQPQMVKLPVKLTKGEDNE